MECRFLWKAEALEKLRAMLKKKGKDVAKGLKLPSGRVLPLEPGEHTGPKEEVKGLEEQGYLTILGDVEVPGVEDLKKEEGPEISPAIKEKLVKVATKLDFHRKSAEKDVYAKDVHIGKVPYELQLNFDQDPKGVRIAKNMRTGEWDKDAADHPDLLKFKRYRDALLAGEEPEMPEPEPAEMPMETPREPGGPEGGEVPREVETGGSTRAVLELQESAASRIADPQLYIKVLDMIEPKDLAKYVWDPKKNPKLPYDDVEPKAWLYEALQPWWEMLTGWRYSIIGSEFQETEKTYECTIHVRRDGPDGSKDITRIKTELKQDVPGRMWKERMEEKAYKKVMRTEIPRGLIDRFIGKYKEMQRR